jgi:hypothetical protein
LHARQGATVSVAAVLVAMGSFPTGLPIRISFQL